MHLASLAMRAAPALQAIRAVLSRYTQDKGFPYGFVTVEQGTAIVRGAAIGAREKVREPGQDRKVATVVYASVMRCWSPYFEFPLFSRVTCRISF